MLLLEQIDSVDKRVYNKGTVFMTPAVSGNVTFFCYECSVENAVHKPNQTIILSATFFYEILCSRKIQNRLKSMMNFFIKLLKLNDIDLAVRLVLVCIKGGGGNCNGVSSVQTLLKHADHCK